MEIFILYLLLCFIVALAGREKKIGYWGVFAFSLFLSPLVGLIIGLVSSKTKKDNIAELRNLAIKYRKGEQVDKSIKTLHQALKNDPENIKVLYDLSCCYSVKNDTEKSFKFLVKAIERGYSDTDKIDSDRDLLSLRNTEDFRVLKSKGYDPSYLKTYQPPVGTSSLDDLRKLKELLDIGAITEDEYNDKKRKILDVHS